MWSGDDPTAVHQAMAETMATCLDQIAAIQQAARAEGRRTTPPPAGR